MATYEQAIVRVLVGGSRATAGVGVAVGAHQVVTCAHVVNTALGRGQRAQARPDDAALVQLEFPSLPGLPSRKGPVIRHGSVVSWAPPPEAGPGRGDVAGIQLTEHVPEGVSDAPFTTAGVEPQESLRVFGYPGNPPRETGAWVDLEFKGGVGNQLLQVESRADQTIRAQPGFSGAPVWRRDGYVVGLLHAAAFAEAERDAYLVPAIAIAEAWEDQFDYLLVPENPYRSLEALSEGDAIFGRDDDIEALTRRVQAHALVVVVGPSGVGKSSLVQAGVIPRLREIEPRSVALMRPGLDPWLRLATATIKAQQSLDDVAHARRESATVPSRDAVEDELQRLRLEGLGSLARYLRSVGHPLLLIVDQLEEIFSDKEAFDSKLLELLFTSTASPRDEPYNVVATLRADFMPALLSVPGLADRLRDHLYPLSPMTRQQLSEAVRLPAAQCGVTIEPRLVDQIVSETGADSLPLLQFFLTKLWDTQRRREISFSGYAQLGGVHGTLNHFAEERAAALPPGREAVLNRVLLRLVRASVADVKQATRQRVYESHVSTPEWETLLHLAEARLVVVGSESGSLPFAELVHEALITSWIRLRGLVEDNMDFLTWREEIEARLKDGDPLPATRIAEAQRWIDERPGDIEDDVKSFIEASKAALKAREHELTTARRVMERERLRKYVRKLVDHYERGTGPFHPANNAAVAFAVESLVGAPTPVRRDRYHESLQRHVPVLATQLPSTTTPDVVDYAPRPSRVVVGTQDGLVRVFDAVLGEEIASVRHDDAVLVVEVSADGEQVASGCKDGSALTLNVPSGRVLSRVHHDAPVTAMAFLQDARYLVTGSRDGFTRVFDVETGAELGRTRDNHPVTAVSASPQGQRHATVCAGHVLRVLDAPAHNDEVFRTKLHAAVVQVAFSTDGSRVATAHDDGLVRIFDAASGRETGRLDGNGVFRFPPPTGFEPTGVA